MRKSRPSKYIGQKFGQLIIQSTSGQKANCLCECGSEHSAFTSNVVRGLTTSCGCTWHTKSAAARTRHGRSHTPEHNIWCYMNARCNNPKVRAYKDYGGRGIKVCERWKSFENFLEDMGPLPSSLHSIERVRVNDGYKPDNCIWMLKSLQSKNRRNNLKVRIQGLIMNVADAARELRCCPSKLALRVKSANCVPFTIKTFIVEPLYKKSIEVRPKCARRKPQTLGLGILNGLVGNALLRHF